MDFPVDYFTGDGTSTTFQLSRIPASATSILVHIGGVKQVASTTDPAYYLDGSKLVFVSPPGAYSPIEVNYLGIAGQVNIPGVQSVTQDMLSLQLANTFVYQTTANGATASFTLNAPPVSANSLVVSANGVIQHDYSVNSNTLTFGFTPPSGTFIRITSLALAQAGVPADGSVTTVKLGSNLTLTGNTSLSGSSGLLINQNAFDSTYFSGTTTPTVQLSTLIGASGFPSSSTMSVTRWGNAAGASGFVSAKSRGTAIGVRGAVSSGDNLGQMSFQGDDGTNFVQSSLVLGACDGTVSSGIVPGRLLFSTMSTAGTLTERMRITSAGDVGIGTSSPAVELEVSSATGSATPTPTEIRIATTTVASDYSTTLPWGRLSYYSADTSDVGPKIQGSIDAISDAANGGRMSMVFSTSAATTGTLTERMRIDSTGNVGIGTNGPSAKLEVQANSTDTVFTDQNYPAYSSGISVINGSATDSNFAALTFLISNAAATNQSASIIAQSTSSGLAANLIFTQRTASNVNTERMRIDSGGNVGIGVSAPTRLLHIDGGASATYFQMTNTASGRTNADGFQIAQDGTAVELINRENGYMGFNTSNTERMRIDSSGRVTMPYQPYFAAHATGSAAYLTVAEGVAFPANSTVFNIGSHYNTSTYRFTAPVTGNYLFTYSTISSTAGAMSRPTFYVNGSSAFNGLQFGISGGDRGSESQATSAIIRLNANDYVDVRSQGGNLYYYGSAHSSFTGILLS